MTGRSELNAGAIPERKADDIDRSQRPHSCGSGELK